MRGGIVAVASVETNAFEICMGVVHSHRVIDDILVSEPVAVGK
jgi:hypothetical protein